jgi:hypothetical protein
VAVFLLSHTPQIPRAGRPSNDQSQFALFNLYSDRVAAVNVIDRFTPGYPSSVAGDSLLVVRGAGDTMCVFRSYADSGILLRATDSAPSFVEYPINPSRIVTHAAIVLAGRQVHFDDGNRDAMRVTLYYDNGDSAASVLSVGNHLRDMFVGHDFCEFFLDFYNLRPTHPLSAELLSDPSGDANYLDAQELRFPPSKRNLRATKIRIASNPLGRPCGGEPLWSAVYLAGLTAWSDFSVSNRLDLPISALRQDDPAWASDEYGGYDFNGQLVGQESTVGALGCAITAFAMLHNYFGRPCTPGTLNEWLQAIRGFRPMGAITIDSVVNVSVNEVVRFRWSGQPWPNVSRFLIEHGAFNPLGVVQVINSTAVGGRATIVQIIQSAPASDFVDGLVRSDADPDLSSRVFSNGYWTFARYTADPAVVESAFADSLPVVLGVRDLSHWVVGSGMDGYWESAARARGTYSVSDPLGGHGGLLPSYGNDFQIAALPMRTSTSRVPRPAYLATVGQEKSLSFLVDAPGTLLLRGPAGIVFHDPNTDAYESTISNAIVYRQVQTFDALSQLSIGPPHDAIFIPEPAVGDYDISVMTASDGRLGLSVEAFDRIGASSSAFATTDVSAAQTVTYRASYEPSGELTLSHLATTSTPDSRLLELAAHCIPNPSSGSVRVVWSQSFTEAVEITVFDLSGRRVAGHSSSLLPAGVHDWTWSGQIRGIYAPSGVYFARVSTGKHFKTLRLVRIGGR